MLSNLSDLLLKRVDPSQKGQIMPPPARATAADSSFLLQQVQQRAPQIKQFYSDPKSGYAQEVQWKGNFTPGAVDKQKYMPSIEQVSAGVQKRNTTEKGRIASGQAPKTGKGKDITNKQTIENIQSDESGFIAPNVYQARNFQPGSQGQNINYDAPYAVVDKRIAPQRTTLYSSKAGTDEEGFRDTTIPEYDPLAITPWAKLSKEDQKLRLEKYGTTSTPYENAPPKLLKSDGNSDIRMSVPVSGSPTGTIAVSGTGGGRMSGQGNKGKVKQNQAKYITIAGQKGSPKGNVTTKASDADIEKWLNYTGEEDDASTSGGMVAMSPESQEQAKAPQKAVFLNSQKGNDERLPQNIVDWMNSGTPTSEPKTASKAKPKPIWNTYETNLGNAYILDGMEMPDGTIDTNHPDVGKVNYVDSMNPSGGSTYGYSRATKNAAGNWVYRNPVNPKKTHEYVKRK